MGVLLMVFRLGVRVGVFSVRGGDKVHSKCVCVSGLVGAGW